MEQNKLTAIFAQNNQKEYLSLICEGIDKIDPSAAEKLKEKLEQDKSYNDQIRAQINGKPKTIDWSRTKNLLNRTDLEKIWHNMDKDNTTVKRIELYKQNSEHDGEFVRGLKKNMTDREIENLIQRQKGKEMDPMASNRRMKYSDEFRCVQKRNGEIYWYSTLEALKQLAEDQRYTYDMIHKTILDISRELLPDYDTFFRSLTLEELTQHLIEQDPLIYEEAQHLKPLKNLKRRVDVPLNTIAKNAEKLYKLYLKKPNATCDENSDNFDHTLLQFNIDTLVKLTVPNVSKEIKQHIHSCKLNGTSFRYTELLHAAIQMEENAQENRPTTELHLNYMTPDELSVNLNSMKINTAKYEDTDSESETDTPFTEYRKHYDVKPKARPPTPPVKNKISHEQITPERQCQSIKAPETTPEAMTEPHSRTMKEIRLEEKTESLNFLQAKNDLTEIKHFHNKGYNILKDRINGSINRLQNDKQMSLEEIHKTIINKLKKRDWSYRVIAAYLCDRDTLNNLYRNTNVAEKKRFDSIMHFYENDIRLTRNSDMEHVECNAITYKQYNPRPNYYLDRMRDRSNSENRNRDRRNEDREYRQTPQRVQFNDRGRQDNRNRSYYQENRRSISRSNSRPRYDSRENSRNREANNYQNYRHNNDRDRYYDRQNRYKTYNDRDNTPRPQSRDRYDDRSRNRYSSDRRENYTQSRNRDNTRYRDRPRDYSESRPRDYSNNRNRSRDFFRSRDFSNDRNRHRDFSNDKNRSRDYSNNRNTTKHYRDDSNKPTNYSYNRSRNYSNDRDRNQMRDRTQSRSVSPWTKNSMKRGLNAPDNYNPRKKYCEKCRNNTHHPWNCQYYKKDWCRAVCTVCNNGNHNEDECREKLRSKIKN